MVYKGGPSRGCFRCRIRRIKCDEMKPGCGQCRISRQVCPGFERNPALSSEASRKHHLVVRPSTSWIRDIIVSSDTIAVPFGHSIPPSLRQTTPELASCHFLANFVVIPHRGHLATTLGYLEFIPQMLGVRSHSEPFKSAFDACAFAALHNRYGPDTNAAYTARLCYIRALRYISVALQDAQTARQNATLAAVLLLAHYEHITAQSLNMHAWGLHVGAAIELVKLRNGEQPKTTQDLVLFIAVRTQMIIHCLRAGTGTPDKVDWWIPDPDGGCAWHFQRLTAQAGELKNEADDVLSTTRTGPEPAKKLESLVNKCRSLDWEITRSLQQLPDSFKWRTVEWQRQYSHCQNSDYSETHRFPGPIDTYADLWIANLWNVMRCMRLVLAGVVVRCTAVLVGPLDYRTTAQYRTAAAVCTEVIIRVIASVPYHFGLVSYGDGDHEKCIAGYFLLYPLVRIMNEDYITDTQRAWVKGQLRYIGDRLGVRYAKTLSQLNLREPSMMVQRDQLRHKLRKISADDRTARPYQHEGETSRMQTQYVIFLERQKDALLNEAFGGNVVDEWTTRSWLRL